MGYTLITAPTQEPVELAAAKSHLRVDFSDDDELIVALISAARGQFERETRRKLISQKWRLSIDRYPTGPIRTDFGPVISVDALKFTDFDASVNLVDPGQYLIDLSTEVARVTPVLFQPWPWVYWATVIRGGARLLPGAVQMEFTAGYGEPKDVPQLIKQAILLIVGHWYSNRETVLGGEGRFMALEMPMAAQAIMDSHAIPGLG